MAEETSTPIIATDAAPVAPATETSDGIPKLPPRMDRPDRNAYDRNKAALEADIKTLTAKREKMFQSIKDAEGGGSDTREARSTLLDSMKELVAGVRVVRKQKEDLFSKRNAIFDQQKKERETLKSMRESLDRFKSVEDIDNAIKKMEYEQSTSSMTLNEEKAMMLKIKEMVKMKGAVAEYDTAAKALKAKDGAGDELKVLCSAKVKEVEAVQAKITVVKAELDKLNVVRDSKRGKVQPLRDEHTKIKKQIDDKYTELKAGNAKWRKDNDKFFDHMNKVKVIKAQIRKAEDELYQKEREEERREREIEEEKQKPWLQEIALCDNLMAYLNGCKPSEDVPVAPTVTSNNKKSSDSGEAMFAVTKKKKKKRKKKGATGKTRINHDFNTINSFSTLAKHSKIKLNTPKTVGDIDDAVAALEKIKAYYDTRPRDPKKKKKAESGESKSNKKTKDGPSKGSKLSTPYGEVTVEKKRKDGVVVAKLPWGQIFISA